MRYIIESSLSKPGNDKEIFLEFTPEGVLELIRTEGFALFDVEECDINALVREYLTPENGELNIVYRYHYPKGRLAAVLGRTRPTLEEEREYFFTFMKGHTKSGRDQSPTKLLIYPKDSNILTIISRQFC